MGLLWTNVEDSLCYLSEHWTVDVWIRIFK